MITLLVFSRDGASREDCNIFYSAYRIVVHDAKDKEKVDAIVQREGVRTQDNQYPGDIADNVRIHLELAGYDVRDVVTEFVISPQDWYTKEIDSNVTG